MAVTFQNPIAVGSNAFELRWSSDKAGPTYRVFRNGKLIAVQRSSRIVLTMERDQHDLVDVLDDGAQPAPVAAPSVVRVLFGPVAGAASYRVERFVGAAWVQQTTIAETGKGQYRHVTTPLPDADAASFRVIAVAPNGEATPVSGSITVHRIPDAPRVTATFNTTNRTVLIAAA